MTLETLSMENLPRPVAEKLDQAARRIRLIVALRGVFAVLAVALISFLAVMTIDAAALLFSNTVRWFLSSCAFAATLGAVYWFLVRPHRKRLGPAQIARVIEMRNRSLHDERISSAVELLSLHDRKQTGFSEKLLQRLVSDAEKDADVVLLKRIFTWRSARPFIMALAVVGFIYASLFIARPQHSLRLLVRAVAPYARVGSIYSEYLTVHPGDARLAVGDSLTVRVEMTQPFTSRVEFRRVGRDGRESVERMRPLEPDREGNTVFFTTVSNISESFQYRVRASRALTGFYRVRVFDRPAVETLHLRREYPDYTGAGVRDEAVAAGRIRVLSGSRLTLAVQPNVPLQDAELLIDGESLGAGRLAARNGEPVYEWTLPVEGRARTVPWQAVMKSMEGFSNQPVRSYDLVVTSDQPPAIAITSPQERRIALAPDGRLPLEYRATDDFGIERIVLRVRPDGAPERIVEQPLPPAHDGEWLGRAELDLAALSLHGADTVRVELLAYDNLPSASGGPNEGVSETITIRIDRDTLPWEMQRIEELRKFTQERLDAIIGELEEAKRTTESVTGLIAQAEREAVEDAVRRAGEARQDLGRIEEALELLAGQLMATQFQRIGEQALGISRDHVSEAIGRAEEMALTDDAPERRGLAGEMDDQVGRALDAARRLQEMTDDLAERLQLREEMRAMAERQQELAQQALHEDWEEMQDAWRERQRELAEQFAQMLAQRQEGMPGMQDLQQRQQQLADQLHDMAQQPEWAQMLDEWGRWQQAMAQQDDWTDTLEQWAHRMPDQELSDQFMEMAQQPDWAALLEELGKWQQEMAQELLRQQEQPDMMSPEQQQQWMQDQMSEQLQQMSQQNEQWADMLEDWGRFQQAMAQQDNWPDMPDWTQDLPQAELAEQLQQMAMMDGWGDMLEEWAQLQQELGELMALQQQQEQMQELMARWQQWQQQMAEEIMKALYEEQWQEVIENWTEWQQQVAEQMARLLQDQDWQAFLEDWEQWQLELAELFARLMEDEDLQAMLEDFNWEQWQQAMADMLEQMPQMMEQYLAMLETWDWREGLAAQFEAMKEMMDSLDLEQWYEQMLAQVENMKLELGELGMPDLELLGLAMPEPPEMALPEFALPEMPELAFPEFEMPGFAMPEFALPEPWTPSFDFGEFALPELPMDMPQLPFNFGELFPELGSMMQAAAEQAAEAGDQGQAAGMAAMAGQMMEGMSEQMSEEGGGIGPGEAEPAAAAGRARPGPDRGDWARFRGRLDGEMEFVEDGSVPTEYRELIRLYFEELSRQDQDRER